MLEEVLPLSTGGEVLFQGLHVVGEGLLAGGSDLAGGPGHLALESFLYGDVARSGKLVNLDAEVSRGGTSLLLDEGEVRLVHPGQYGHYGQSELGMQQRI